MIYYIIKVALPLYFSIFETRGGRKTAPTGGKMYDVFYIIDVLFINIKTKNRTEGDPKKNHESRPGYILLYVLPIKLFFTSLFNRKVKGLDRSFHPKLL